VNNPGLPPPPAFPPPALAGGPAAQRSLQLWVWAGGAAAVIGIIAVVAWVGYQFFEMSSEVDNFVRSGAGQPAEFVVDHPVDWTVFVEPQAASLTGVRFQIWDVEAGRRVDMQSYGGTFSYGFPEHTGRAVATVALDPGTYSIQVEGSGVNLALGPSPAHRVVRMIVGGLLVGVPLVIGGMATAVVAALRQSRRKNRNASRPPPSSWSSGEWPTGGR